MRKQIYITTPKMVQTRGPTKRKPSTREEEKDKPIQVTKRGGVTGVSPAPKVPARTPTKAKVSKSTPKKSPIVRKASAAASSQVSNGGNEIRLDKITEQEILTANKTGELVDLINQLTGTAQDELFSSYKAKTKVKLDQDQSTIERLEEELKAKDQIIEDLKRNNKPSTSLNPLVSSQPQDDTDLFISPIRKRRNLDEEIINRDDINKELNTVGVILDMVQLLTGLKVINHEQDDNNFYFDVIQNSTAEQSDMVVIEYRLVIVKKLSSATEVNYIPTFLDTENKQREILKKYLPEYFCDDLTFPYKALSQFYGKMNKALNKITNR